MVLTPFIAQEKTVGTTKVRYGLYENGTYKIPHPIFTFELKNQHTTNKLYVSFDNGKTYRTLSEGAGISGVIMEGADEITLWAEGASTDFELSINTGITERPRDLFGLERQVWLLDGSYTERWEQGFRKYLYHGRTGAFFKSESTSNKAYEKWTKPTIVDGGNTIGVAPWDDSILMKNSIDGTTVDELYLGFPKAHHRQVLTFEAELPSPTGLTNLYAGFEVNSGGNFNLLACLACHTAQWQLYALNYKNAAKTSNVTLRHAGAWARYALVYDPPILQLWEAPVASAVGFPLELTATIDLGDIRGKAIPFFANEDTSVSEFEVGEIYIWELLDYLARYPNIYNVTMTSADTEYSQALPSLCRKYLIHTRDESVFRLAFVTGKVATPTAPYFTIPSGKSHDAQNIKTGSLTLYFASASAGKIIEIIAWE